MESANLRSMAGVVVGRAQPLRVVAGLRRLAVAVAVEASPLQFLRGAQSAVVLAVRVALRA